MEKQEILSHLNVIFADILDNENLILTENSSAKDIEEWDSLNHIQLVVSIEKHFKIKFTTQEIQNWKNAGEIISSISSHLNNR